MTALTHPAGVAAVLALGYLLGRARPLHRARDWAYWHIRVHASTHWPSLTLVVAAALLPEILVRALLLRRSAGTERVPAPQLSEEWRQRLDRAQNRGEAP